MNSKKNVVIAVLVALVAVIVILVVGVMYFNKNKLSSVAPVTNKTPEAIQKKQIAEAQAAYNKEFPDLITGVINIVSDKKTTIKADNGTVYLVSPAMPMLFFKNSMVKDGGAVKTRGKILENNNFTIGSIIPNTAPAK
jgi:hypothetical protein